jgi:uncharacterized protein YjiS (DUF1127 family)
MLSHTEPRSEFVDRGSASISRSGTLTVRGWIAGLWPRLCRLVAESRRRSRSRRELLTLNERMLSDIGLTQMDVFKETKKRFWQA